MQECKEKHKNALKLNMKRPRSTTRYPRRMPTYVVAFAVHETYDNFNNAQQIDDNDQTPKTSFDSINTLRALDIAEMENAILQNTDDNSNNEVKIEISADIEQGFTIDPPQINDYLLSGYNNMEEVSQQPEVIFNATRYNKRPDNGKFLRKAPRKYKRVGKFRNIHFKYKNPRNSLTTRLNKFYEKAQKKSDNSVKIQKYFYVKSITQVVSRSRILKKALAKENLQDDVDRISLTDNMQFIENDNSSLTSRSNTMKSFTSNSSENTLTRKGSTSSSRNIDFYSPNNTSSVIEVSSENMIPYKTEVINVAVAVAYNPSKVSENDASGSLNAKQMFALKDSLTSAEITTFTPDGLTSQPPSNNTTSKTAAGFCSKDIAFTDRDISNDTLIGTQKKSSLDMSSDEDTFFIAKTSSDFNNASLNSTYTLITNSDSRLAKQNVCPSIFDENMDVPHKPTLLDTVINMGMFPEITPSTSSSIRCNDGNNNVIVTADLNKHFTISQITGTTDVKRQISKNVLRKPFDLEQNTVAQNNLNLPNEAKIKGIREGENQQKFTCSDEFRNSNPSNLNEMWERLVLVLDLAVKRLEETLSEKIIRELKKTLANFDPLKRKFTHADTANGEFTVNTLTIDINNERNTKEALVQNSTTEANEADMCLQCNLIKNNVIDQIMLKLSMEGPKFPTGGCSTKSLQKLIKPKIIRDYFEILKAPAVGNPVEVVSKENVVTVTTTAEEIRSEEVSRFSNLKLLFRGPVEFVRENVYVITSVPAFFIILLCFYGLIVVVMKP